MTRDEVVGGLGQVGVPERVVVDVVGGDGVAVVVPLHARVAVAAEATQEAVVGDPQRGHGGGELAAAVLAEPVLAVGGEVLQLGDQDLAHLAAGAGHQGDPAALGDVLRHRGALADRLVVGVGVDEQQALVGGVVMRGRVRGRSDSRGRSLSAFARAGRNGRSGSSQSTWPSSPAASQRTWSCSTGRGSPGDPSQGDDQVQSRDDRRPPASHPVTSTWQPSSSAISRTSAAAGSSPGSTLPPGSSQRPAAAGGAVRRAARTRPSRMIAAPTTSVMGRP